jgi:CTP-dependent riboflavin kinase
MSKINEVGCMIVPTVLWTMLSHYGNCKIHASIIILCYIAGKEHRHGSCTATLEYMAEVFKVSRSTVSRAISRLKDDGLIIRDGKALYMTDKALEVFNPEWEDPRRQI